MESWERTGSLTTWWSPRAALLSLLSGFFHELDISSCTVQATAAFGLSVLCNQCTVPANYSIAKINYAS